MQPALNQYKIQEMCAVAVRIEPYLLKYVPDLYKIQDMCEKAVLKNPVTLEYVPDQFITPKMVKNLYNEENLKNNEDLHEINIKNTRL